MATDERVELIKEIQKARQSVVISYVTSDRPNLFMQIAGDTPRLFYDHLVKYEKKIPRLDLFLYSAGGDSSVPWRLVSLFREFSDELNVLVPYRAYSAATMIALGADSIIMGRKAELGPIDPTVENEFNPIDPFRKGRRLGISVEDVTSYINLVKDKVGLVHQPEISQAFDSLSKQVHPITLGYVNRHYSFIRMVARKLLGSHKQPQTESEIDEIVKNLVERIYFHGHGIARSEAKELLLNIVNPPSALEDLMWRLYLCYENELQLTSIFNPEDVLDQAGGDDHVLQGIKGAFIESEYHSHVFKVDIKVMAIRQVPPSVTLSISIQAPQNLQMTPQQLQQLQGIVQQMVMNQLRAQSPIADYGFRLANIRWEKER